MTGENVAGPPCSQAVHVSKGAVQAAPLPPAPEGWTARAAGN
ncbi:hypothetical protein HNQ79_005968 [Streptomyces candidus]|uniref:Uncharacterized protein n=1 Tax=Streptomyces candidus TaxID=67283 RepID=A0A7X0LTW1_9ACTN|nr:hypothetical protein [Streptomyces candidus]